VKAKSRGHYRMFLTGERQTGSQQGLKTHIVEERGVSDNSSTKGEQESGINISGWGSRKRCAQYESGEHETWPGKLLEREHTN